MVHLDGDPAVGVPGQDGLLLLRDGRGRRRAAGSEPGEAVDGRVMAG